MSGFHRIIKAGAVIACIGLTTACFAVRVSRNVGDPVFYFDRAHRKIARIHRTDPGRRDRGHEVHIMIYDQSDLELIRVSAPFWLVDKCMELGRESDEWDDEREIEDRYDFDWRGLEGLHELGPGLLVEIEDDEAHILIWIE